MRIDLNHGPQQLAESERSSSQSTTASGVSSAANAPGNALGEDQAQLSGAHAQVETLAAQAAQLPEIREARVHALRQAIQGGQYTASHEQVAGALLTHLIAGSAA